MTPKLIRTLAAHALNNLRVINHMTAEMLAAAAVRNLPRLDESLYFELFTPTTSKPCRIKALPLSCPCMIGFCSKLSKKGATRAPSSRNHLWLNITLILLDQRSLDYRISSQTDKAPYLSPTIFLECIT